MNRRIPSGYCTVSVRPTEACAGCVEGAAAELLEDDDPPPQPSAASSSRTTSNPNFSLLRFSPSSTIAGIEKASTAAQIASLPLPWASTLELNTKVTAYVPFGVVAAVCTVTALVL